MFALFALKVRLFLERMREIGKLTTPLNPKTLTSRKCKSRLLRKAFFWVFMCGAQEKGLRILMAVEAWAQGLESNRVHI